MAENHMGKCWGMHPLQQESGANSKQESREELPLSGLNIQAPRSCSGHNYSGH